MLLLIPFLAAGLPACSSSQYHGTFCTVVTASTVSYFCCSRTFNQFSFAFASKQFSGFLQIPLGFLRVSYGSLGFLNFPQGSLGFNQVSEDFLGFLRVFKVPQFSKGFFRDSQNFLKFRRVRCFQCSLEFPFGLLRVPGIVGLNSIQSCLSFYGIFGRRKY